MDLPERLRYLDGAWSNDACRGYLIFTLQKCGKSNDEICQALDYLHTAFDQITVAEAKQIWRDF